MCPAPCENSLLLKPKGILLQASVEGINWAWSSTSYTAIPFRLMGWSPIFFCSPNTSLFQLTLFNNIDHDPVIFFLNLLKRFHWEKKKLIFKQNKHYIKFSFFQSTMDLIDLHKFIIIYFSSSLQNYIISIHMKF